ncbi:SRPBCC domain-containing protein [Methyloceanibacter sp.]|uniref:SRPBCC family protein n=1 Tax=Methyloceanibacter sp. TaxID=1965321 RepID=UPI002D53F3ED|nr:SRPBCC domain-containing protein [Methyloceanibacter sp.]HZP09228.1 SRPBCC domain-containing protein [Methyloceanibacter sp.]
MNDIKEKSNAHHADDFVITRVVNAPVSRVWKAWTDARDLKQWWGPKGHEIVSTKVDLRPGGIFHYHLRSPSGEDIWGKFVYREIVPEQRLVFITSFSDENAGETRHPMAPDWPLKMLSTVTFAEKDGKTTVTVRWSPYEPTPKERDAFEAGRDSMKAGWTGTFERLEAYLGVA